MRENGDQVKEKLSKILTAEELRIKEPLKEHTTFKVGGPADFYVIPRSTDSLKKVIALCHEQKTDFYIIGNGSNIVFGDKGYRGVVIEIGKGMKEISFENNVVKAEAGIRLSELAKEAAKRGLSGLEFAAGIPGTLGGGVTMNAGAYGGEIKDSILSAVVLTEKGEVRTFLKDDLALSYRHSIILEKNMIVLEAAFELQEKKVQEIEDKMKELNQKRREKQPLNYPSAGSTFKRPEGYFAGKLIEDAGLRGYRVGDAMVSEKHCGFVVNVGSATAADILTLIEDVTRIIKEKTGVLMEPEVRLIGEF